MSVFQDVTATVNGKVQPNLLSVRGLVEAQDGAIVTLEEAQPQGTKPSALFLNVIITPPGGKGAFVPFYFEKSGDVDHYGSVILVSGDDMLSVEVEYFGR